MVENKKTEGKSSDDDNNKNQNYDDDTTTLPSHYSLSHDYAKKEKIKVAITSILASASLTIIKLVIGVFTNSLGILSEAMHSGLDVVAAIMTLYAVKMAMRPPDPEHPYGYAKFESLASLAEIILLLIIAAWIFYEGIERVLFRQAEVHVSIFSFIVMIISIIVDFGRSRTLYKIAHKYGSQALEADALHFRVDMLTSSIVFAGLVIVFLFGIPNADAYAAITVAGLIIYTSLGLGRRTLDVLLDKSPKGIQAHILESITGFEGIKKAHSVRVRRVGPKTYIDMHIELPRIFTHDKAHRIATMVEDKIKEEIMPNSDVVVHVDAIEDTLTETIKDKIRLIAAETPAIKNIHSMYLSNINSDLSLTTTINEQKDRFKKHSFLSLHLYLDVQMDNKLEFKTAHDIIDNFEKKVKDQIPSIERITTHIETELDIESSIGNEKQLDSSYLNKIRGIVLSIEGVSDCKDIGLVNIYNDLHITLTIRISSYKRNDLTENNNNDCRYLGRRTIEDVHEIATNVQNAILSETGASRVIVHTEPD